MSVKKKLWKEPVVKSIDQCQPIFGECKVGNSPTTDGTYQCYSGTGASSSGTCTTGNGAKVSCAIGNGVA